jgi:CheY-like chemotaxis protein
MQQVVMVVDDNEDLRYVVQSALVSRFDVTVVEAADGQQALARIANGLRPDVIISDFKMPNMDGFALTRELRKIGFQRPVIFMTGLRPELLIKEAFGLGGFDFVSKPLGEKFFEAVGNALALVKLNWEVAPNGASSQAGIAKADAAKVEATDVPQGSKTKAS